MSSIILSYYLDKYCTVKRAPTTYGRAPHKPILLLALMEQIEGQQVVDNNIALDERLLECYQRHWKMLVRTKHNPNIGLPIYHLQNDGFWKTITKSGELLSQPISSNRQFLIRLDYGHFDKALFDLLIDPDLRALFRMVLIDTYFSESKKEYQLQLPNLFQEIELEILEEAQPRYRTKTSTIESYVRNWKFQHHIKKVYDYTCCVSGLKIDPPELSIIEACHIRPHAQLGIDTITNGIPLCAHLHRAFDRGLLSISSDYRVLIKNKKSFQENDSPLNIRQFEKKSILLPQIEKYHPSQEHLSWHRVAFGF